LLARALTCRQYFHEDREIGDLATLLYSQYDFPWMTDGDGKLLSHGWRPEGFIKFRYDKYCQLAAMYLLGIGSPTHPLPPDAWYAGERTPNSYVQLHRHLTALDLPVSFRMVRLPGAARESGHKSRLVRQLPDRYAGSSQMVFYRSGQTVSRLQAGCVGHYKFLEPDRI
jgi:hypothetical protein